ncbi:hypothetical protein [Nonomuraea soli]|uniref:DUF1837 domain-containing protein n=1 Tax=Nonomuraea soli TaxID=1032476 RepID=A0A7W0CUT2_9ACTN|nr:hypothetical protein [Nonomuraea soli]MBA2897733.1 hypothetical protein [Nonomuraea soli]
MTELLGIVARPENAGCSYLFGGPDAGQEALETVTRLLAEEAMRLPCGASPALDKWRARRDGCAASESPELDRREIEVFIGPVFGLPTSTQEELDKITHHLQGFVAELLWNRIIQDQVQTPDGRILVHTEEIKGDPTGTGGDGFVVYAIDDGTLVFRLWEIKKHVSNSPIAAKIKGAAEQLSGHGARYLALLTGPGTKHDGALGELYGHLVTLWLENSFRAGIGVSIATSTAYAPTSHPAFDNVAAVFPQFPADGQREALMVAITDFAHFAEEVRKEVWRGL